MIDFDQFRRFLLQPILRAITTRGLTSQIDCVAYSCDLPYVVSLELAFAGQPNPSPQTSVSASVTGLTYLWQMVESEELDFVGLNTNRYFRRPDAGTGDVTSHAFRSWYGWNKDGRVNETGRGERYLLSTKLGVTRGTNVNTREEILYYLRRSVAADGAQPDGTIYYVRNGNVRSTARHDAFPAAVRQLGELGVAAKILRGRLPDGRKNVQGTTVGTSNFNWRASGSRILPGAICDNMTSYGGALHHRTNQTTIDQFLRNGAAGASGTVSEPLALQAKFPTPSIHVHYARGYTLAESYYQSIAAPYQLLIVGDPLCSPWATIPEVEATRLSDRQRVRGLMSFTPKSVRKAEQVERFELFLDGRRISRCSQGESFSLDTTRLADGWHDLRIVGMRNNSVETPGGIGLRILIDNHGRRVELTGPEDAEVESGESISLRVRSEGATKTLLYANGQPLAEIPGPGGKVIVRAGRLGRGRVVVRAVAYNGKVPHAIAEPLELQIAP